MKCSMLNGSAVNPRNFGALHWFRRKEWTQHSPFIQRISKHLFFRPKNGKSLHGMKHKLGCRKKTIIIYVEPCLNSVTYCNSEWWTLIGFPSLKHTLYMFYPLLQGLGRPQQICIPFESVFRFLQTFQTPNLQFSSNEALIAPPRTPRDLTVIFSFLRGFLCCHKGIIGSLDKAKTNPIWRDSSPTITWKKTYKSK